MVSITLALLYPEQPNRTIGKKKCRIVVLLLPTRRSKTGFVLTPYWDREWVLAGHLEYEHTPEGSSQPVRERISEDSYFKFSTNVPELYPGQQLRLALDCGFGGNMGTGSVSKLSNLFDVLDHTFYRVAYSSADVTAA